MQSASPVPDATVTRLRQQLILAQVRLMELEDERDELAPRLAETERLLGAAQTLADAGARESAHLEQARADLQAQFEHMRHMQHVTNEALGQVRQELATVQAALTQRDNELAAAQRAQAAESARVTHLQEEANSLSTRLRETEGKLEETSRKLQASLGESERRLTRLNQLDAEVRGMKATLSWRWTAWLRSIRRLLRRR